MTEKSTIYEKAPTTERLAESLAQRHGFESIAHLAAILPKGAYVMDAGAGASPFGKEVAALRPDITWVNFDYSYNDPAILEDISRDAPGNVMYIAGDVTRLEELYPPETFDAVFSYWLLPHLSLEDKEPAEEAVRALFMITKTDGLISIGPKVGRKKHLPSVKRHDAVGIPKTSDMDIDVFTKGIVTATALKGLNRSIQKLSNEVVTPFLGTTRYIKREDGKKKVYHPESCEYVSYTSREGLATLNRLMVAVVSRIIRPKKNGS